MSVDSISQRTLALQSLGAHRPTIAGTRHMAVAGHYLAAHAAFDVLQSGGNAIDAGVAAGLVLGVVQSELVNIAGVAPIMLYSAEHRKTVTISGLGTWPATATAVLFRDRHGGHIPQGVLRTVVPAAPDAWILALEKFGTMTFGDVAGAAIRFARDGFVMYPLMAELIAAFETEYRRWPSNAAIYLPGGKPPKVGELFVQTDLARTLQYMVDEERRRATDGRLAGLAAARGAFYRGDIAREIVRYHEENDGLLTMADLAGYASEIEEPLSISYGGHRVHACRPWCQGPVLLQMLKMLDIRGVTEYAPNSPEYIHLTTEVMKLAFADRHDFYGDPRFVAVDLERLLSDDYARMRVASIDLDRVLPVPLHNAGAGGPTATVHPAAKPALDTSYVCTVDSRGNVFSATPSDVSFDTPVIPGLGICPSSRGSQSWADPRHPSSVAPGKRPRLTPSPAMAVLADGRIMPFGTPGGDVQAQAMLQVFLNIASYGMDVQAAVEQPRFATYSFPDSFEPHHMLPNRLVIESRIEAAVSEALATKGHDVAAWPPWTWRAGSVCCILYDPDSRISLAGADPRRPCYSVGW